MNPTSKVILYASLSLLLLIFCSNALALTSEQIIQLKKAGVDDKTIELIIQNKADLTGDIDVEEVIKMKQAGVSDSVIQAMATPQENPERVKEYGTHVGQVKDMSTEDLMKLKNAGFDDSLIEAVVKIQQQQLWPYLMDLGVFDCEGRGRPYPRR